MKLTGLSQKVFLDRYSLKDKKGNPVEKTPNRMWNRVSNAVAAVETKENQSKWQKEFYHSMENFKYVPGGRILAGAGTGFDVTYYNCLPPDQEILTPEGYKPISKVKVGDKVITGKKRERLVKRVFIRETEEPLYVITQTKLGFDDVRVTGEHPILAIKNEWVNRHRNRDGLKLKHEPQWIKAADLAKGDFVAVAWNNQIREVSKINIKRYLPEGFSVRDGFLTREKLRKPVKADIDIDEKFMLLAGTWLGDGCVTHRARSNIPAGIQITFNKKQKDWAYEIASILQEKFSIIPTVRVDQWGQQLIQVRVESYPVGMFFNNFFGAYSHKKKIPQVLMEQPKERILPLVKGMFRADGYLTDNNLGIALSNKQLATQLHQLILQTGRFFTIFKNNAKNGRHDTYRVSGGISQANGLCEYIFGEKRKNTYHDQDYFLTHDDLFWVRIKSIKTTPYKGKVYDLEVEEDHSFITGGVVVSNCFVIPSPADSRGGILDTLKQMVEIMARGGGVGINLSSLRPRGQRVEKVNGFSSGPCNWAELFSVATKDIIQQGGCFTGDARIATHLGLVKIEDIMKSGKNYYAQTHKGLKKITARFDNGVKEVFEVETEGGYKVKTTAGHKFLTFNENGAFYLEELSNLKQRDHAVLLPSMLSDEIPEVILKSDIPLPSKFSYGRINIDFPKTLTRELAFIIGVYFSDGSRIKDEYAFAKGIRFAADAKRTNDLAFLVRTLKTLGLNPKIRKGDGAVFDVSVFSRDLVEYFKINNFLKENSSKVFVPEQIFSSPRRVIEAFIAGVFFGDGSNRGGKGGFRITSVNKKFLEDIQSLLINVNVASKIKREKRIAPWQDLYTVTVNGNRWMGRFFDLVRDYSEKAYDNKISVRDGFYNFPINILKRFAYLSGIQRTIAYTNPTTSYKTLAFINNSYQKLQDKDIEDVEILTSTMTDKIKSITSVGREPVYDLEVEDAHLLSGNGFYTSNSRRGALMLMLWDWHPDIEEFITVKQDLTRINGANLSVCISDSFMEAVEQDGDWELIFPDRKDPEYDTKWDGDIYAWKALGKKVVVHKKIKARAMWDLIAEAAWKSAEPGVVFMERYNKLHNNWYWNRINCVNPCVIGDTLITTQDGETKAKDLKIGDKILTPKGFKSIDKVYNNGVQRIYKVSFSDGGELDATGDHKLRILRKGTYEWIKVTDLEKGDEVMKLAPIFKQVNTPNFAFANAVGPLSMPTVNSSVVDFELKSDLARVIRVQDTGREEEVYDVHEPETLTWITNGYVSLDCGEEGLPPWGVCNLGSINLSALVRGNNLNRKGTFDFKELKRVTRAAVRFQDNVVEMDPYVFNGIRKTQYEGERRIGLGTMGLGDTLIKLHMRYGSRQSLKFIEKIYRIIRDESYKASVEIAVEKGSFGKFDSELYSQGKFIKQLPQDIQESIKGKGIRNSILLMQAPTGSTSLLVDTTSGIEPVYEFEFIRRDRIGEHVVRHHLYEEWYKKYGKDLEAGKIKRPDFFVSANDLTPEDHINVQAIIQKYVDASISKTVNAPAAHTVEDVKRLYTLAYKLGCKGIAYMREGSRAGVLERVDGKKKEEAPSTIPEKPAPPISKRPSVMYGLTYKTQTPLGDAFITLNKDDQGNPFETFITVGKSGSDVAAMTDALGRMISIVLRLQSPVTSRERIRQIVAQLSGIGGVRTVGFGENRVRSVPDAVAKVLAEEFGFSVNGIVKDLGKKEEILNNGNTLVQQVPAENLSPDLIGANGSNGHSPRETSGQAGQSLTENTTVLEQLSIAAEPSTHNAFDFCPSCGGATLAHEEGCEKCYSCGYSEC